MKLNGELSRDILRDFAKYIIPYIRDFAESAEGKRYITQWQANHPEYDAGEEYLGYDYDADDEDDEL